MKKSPTYLFIIFALAIASFGQGSYMKPPKPIMDVLNAPVIPVTTVAPSGDRIALLEPERYPPIAELAEPMLRLGGLRINPATNSQHRQLYFTGIKFQSVDGGAQVAAAVPAGSKMVSPQWSPDGRHLAAGRLTDTGVELWIIDAATGKATRAGDVYVNTAYGGFSWEGSDRLSAMLVPAGRGAPPQYRDIAPSEPNIQETSGRSGAVATFQDLLRSPNDERLFEYYTTSQPAFVSVSGNVTTIGEPAIYDTFSPSPDGNFILVTRVKRP
ncbi:MAG TPA: hypothetical protein VK918_04485, partial [Pyrinomonadaceae bacterium]|nr:hypothetical protein [Pyrinomonadaceae bacterium]